MFYSLRSDPIGLELQCSERLKWCLSVCYSEVLLLLGLFVEHWLDVLLLVVPVHCSRDLVWRVSEAMCLRVVKKNIVVTWFVFKALARCSAPCGPIWLPTSSSVVSVWNKVSMFWREGLLLLRLFLEHWQYVLFLEVRIDCLRGLV